MFINGCYAVGVCLHSERVVVALAARRVRSFAAAQKNRSSIYSTLLTRHVAGIRDAVNCLLSMFFVMICSYFPEDTNDECSSGLNTTVMPVPARMLKAWHSHLTTHEQRFMSPPKVLFLP